MICITQDLAQQRDVVQPAAVRYTPPSAMGHVGPLGYELFGLAGGSPDRRTSRAMRCAPAAVNMWDGVLLDHVLGALAGDLASGRALRPSFIFQRAD